MIPVAVELMHYCIDIHNPFEKCIIAASVIPQMPLSPRLFCSSVILPVCVRVCVCVCVCVSSSAVCLKKKYMYAIFKELAFCDISITLCKTQEAVLG